MKQRITAIALGVWGIAFQVFAQTSGGLTNPQGGGTPFQVPNPIGCGDLGCVVSKIIDVIFYVSIPVVTIMVLIGGFQILTAGGDPEKFKDGKNTILYAVIGFVVILGAKGLVAVIQQVFSGGGGAAAPTNYTCPGSPGCPECSGVTPPAYCSGSGG